MLAHEQPDFPGENFVNESKIIENIIRDLAPELLQQPTVLSRIYAYIFTAPGQHQPSFTQLRRCMDEAMSDHSKANLTTLSSIIKGALRFRTALSIASFPAFDQELHIRKEKILSEIFDPETAPDLLPSTLHTGKNN